jgi:hypothetical protein
MPRSLQAPLCLYAVAASQSLLGLVVNLLRVENGMGDLGVRELFSLQECAAGNLSYKDLIRLV